MSFLLDNFPNETSTSSLLKRVVALWNHGVEGRPECLLSGRESAFNNRWEWRNGEHYPDPLIYPIFPSAHITPLLCATDTVWWAVHKMWLWLLLCGQRQWSVRQKVRDGDHWSGFSLTGMYKAHHQCTQVPLEGISTKSLTWAKRVFHDMCYVWHICWDGGMHTWKKWYHSLLFSILSDKHKNLIIILKLWGYVFSLRVQHLRDASCKICKLTEVPSQSWPTSLPTFSSPFQFPWSSYFWNQRLPLGKSTCWIFCFSSWCHYLLLQKWLCLKIYLGWRCSFLVPFCSLVERWIYCEAEKSNVMPSLL